MDAFAEFMARVDTAMEELDIRAMAADVCREDTGHRLDELERHIVPNAQTATVVFADLGSSTGATRFDIVISLRDLDAEDPMRPGDVFVRTHEGTGKEDFAQYLELCAKAIRDAA